MVTSAATNIAVSCAVAVNTGSTVTTVITT